MSYIEGESSRETALAFVLHGHKKDSDALGFLPRCTIQRYADLGWISFARINGELCSFCVFGIHKKGLKIYQIWTIQDCRRLAAAAAALGLAHDKAEAAGKKISSAWVAEDLGARYFWEAVGYELIGLRSGGTSRGRIHLHFAKRITEPQPLSTSQLTLAELLRQTSQSTYQHQGEEVETTSRTLAAPSRKILL